MKAGATVCYHMGALVLEQQATNQYPRRKQSGHRIMKHGRTEERVFSKTEHHLPNPGEFTSLPPENQPQSHQPNPTTSYLTLAA